MIDTSEYYGGTYPSPIEEIEYEEQGSYQDYDSYMDERNDDFRMGIE